MHIPPLAVTVTGSKIKQHFEKRFFSYAHTYAMQALFQEVEFAVR